MNSSDFGQEVIQIVKRKIVPFAFILYFFNFMDRVNIGFASLTMNDSLGISKIEFGNIASAFFITYLIFQIPANMALLRVGARRWIALIVTGWGCITALMFFTQNSHQLLIGRMVIGVFEAGFFPGIVYYLACWFPERERAKVTSLFMVAIAVSSVIASPMSGWVVQHLNTPNYEGWRWLFAIEGIPTIALGLLTLRILPDTPNDAKWLSEPQKKWLFDELNRENEQKPKYKNPKLITVLSNGTLWKLAMVYMLIQASSQASNYWLPGQVKGFTVGLTDTQVGLIMAVPYICAIFSMPLWSAHSDKTGERKWHAALPMLLAAISYVVIASAPSMPLRLFGMAMFGVGILSFYGPYWAIPPALLSPAGLAVSIAFINSCSSLGGFGANKIVGYIAQNSGSHAVLIFQGALCLASFLILLTLRVPRQVSHLKPEQ